MEAERLDAQNRRNSRPRRIENGRKINRNRLVYIFLVSVACTRSCDRQAEMD